MGEFLNIIIRIGSATLNHLEITNTKLASTRTELNGTKLAVEDLTAKFNGKYYNISLQDFFLIRGIQIMTVSFSFHS
jgi:hypothetical protein